MDSLLIDREGRSARHVSDSRKVINSARYKPSVVTSSKSDSSLKMHLKSGVMNLSFTCEDDFPHSKSLTDNDDVFSPMTSPKSDFYPEMYHKAVSRRKPADDDLNDELPSIVSPTSGTVRDGIDAHKMMIKSPQGVDHTEQDTVFYDFVNQTSASEEVDVSLDLNMAASIVEDKRRYKSRASAPNLLLSMKNAGGLSEYGKRMDKEWVLEEGDEDAE